LNRMKVFATKFFLLVTIFVILISAAFTTSNAANAQSPDEQIPSPQLDLEPAELPPEEFFRGKVLSAEQPESIGVRFQRVKVEVTTGSLKGEVLNLDHGGTLTIREDELVREGEEIVLIAIPTFEGKTDYFIVDKYRLPPVLWIIAIFFALAIFFGRARGLGALAGLAISVFVIVKLVLPKILEGGSPLASTFLGIAIILPVSIFLAHGFSKRTSVALLSGGISIALSAGLAILFVNLSKLSGLGSEETLFLQVGQYGEINFQGLLLAGILIGALGVLDDITAAQSAVVDELSKANPKFSPAELYKIGISVGREHIASLVNTLVLAYAGASLPLLLLFSINKNTPLWVNLNSGFISEEIIRAVVGSLALILAVPITTWLASRLLKK